MNGKASWMRIERRESEWKVEGASQTIWKEAVSYGIFLIALHSWLPTTCKSFVLFHNFAKVIEFTKSGQLSTWVLRLQLPTQSQVRTYCSIYCIHCYCTEALEIGIHVVNSVVDLKQRLMTETMTNWMENSLIFPGSLSRPSLSKK